MTTDEKDRLIEIMRQNIAEKEKYIYGLIRENIKLKGKRHTITEEGRKMKAKIEIMGSEGRYFARATGRHVSIQEIEILDAGWNETSDLWRAAGQDNNRRIAIPKDELSWMADGTWREYPYELITKDGTN